MSMVVHIRVFTNFGRGVVPLPICVIKGCDTNGKRKRIAEKKAPAAKEF